jgi:primosomal protein N' (replication factor Y)
MASLADVIATIVPVHVPRPRRRHVPRIVQHLTDADDATLRRRSSRQWAVYRAVSDNAHSETALAAALGNMPGWLPYARRLAARGLIEIIQGESHPIDTERNPLSPGDDTGKGARNLTWPEPTPTQHQAIATIDAGITASEFSVLLLFGVTGSGKTNVYLHAARTTLAAGRSVLILVPEIGLTHEIAERAKAHFGRLVAVLHSGLSPRERWSEWARVRRGDARVVVGPRSAVFAPLRALGLVVIDEEHDSAYKQEEGVRYSGRDLAIVRARSAGCPAVLGSATPSVESFHHAQEGRYTLLELSERPGGRPMPTVSLVDARRDAPQDGPEHLCSDTLQTAIDTNGHQGGQTLLFLNRRGFSQYVQCGACGTPVRCSACSVTLTLHQGRRALICHHCGLVRSITTPCDQCGGQTLQGRSAGTEQIEAALVERFPTLRVARMDRDSTGARGAQKRLLRSWHDGTIDVLVGTQMVTKGVDNPRVTLVGVLNADIALNLPDFRAAERTFQLVSQVAGRAGRGEMPGAVLVQTLQPDHYSMQAAAAHDYRTFFTAEIEFRRALGYPPFRRLVNVRFEAHDSAVAERIAREFAARLRSLPNGPADGLQVLGPAPAPIERLRGWHRWQALIRGPSAAAMRTAIGHGLADVQHQLRAKHTRIVVDVDPASML